MSNSDTLAALADERFVALTKKYGLEYRVALFIERLGASGTKDRVLVRITPAGAPPARPQ